MLGFLKKLVLGFGKLLLALMLIFAIYAVYGMYAERSASRKAAAMCASITSGSDATALRDLAISDGASDFQTRWFKSDGLDNLFITYVGLPPFSRHICHVKAKDGSVVSAEQAHLD